MTTDDEGLVAAGGWWSEGAWVDIESGNGDVVRRVPIIPRIEPLPGYLEPAVIAINIEEMNDTFARIRRSMDQFVAAYRNFYNPEWNPDPRQGEWVPVHSLQPGAKVFILEGVFTVSVTDMDAPIPTVWLVELPDSPLYFDYGENIPLANESKD